MALALKQLSVWCLLANWCADLAKTDVVPTCVSVYHEFEEAAITNNPENVHSLFSTFYSPNHPLPFSVVILYQVQFPNGTTQQVSSGTGCSSELWMWTYSPVFLWVEPSILNKMTLYALNGHEDWKSPMVTLTVPLPCQNVSYSFLNEMTMTVSWSNIAIYTHSDPITHFYCMTFFLVFLQPPPPFSTIPLSLHSYIYSYSLYYLFLFYCIIVFIHCTTHTLSFPPTAISPAPPPTGI